jgi:Ca2+-binding RTX toxin-like protein
MNFLQTLRQWAASPAAEKNLQSIFGDHINWVAAYRHLDALRRGDFSLLPPIEVLEGAAMPGLWGGYSRDLRRIFLSADCTEELITPVLLEEVGHFFDQEFCTEETPGEEGALFAALVLGLPLESASRDDSLAPLFLEGRQFLVEAARKLRGSSKGGYSSKSGRKKRGSSNGGGSNSVGGGGSGYAEVGGRSSNPKLQENILYATQDGARIPQKAAGDRLIGSRGNDTFVVLSQDVKIEDPSGGTDTVESSVNFSIASHNVIENLVLSGSGNTSAFGNLKANVISGNSGNNKLDGGTDSAEDTLTGGAGNDTYVIRDFSDTVVEVDGQGSDTIETTINSIALSDFGIAHVENLTFSGSGSSTLTGNDLANFITGGSGADTIFGEEDDTLAGGQGDDWFKVLHASAVIVEGSGALDGNDTISTALSTYSFAAFDNIEVLDYTGSRNSNLTGNSSSNWIFGGLNVKNTISGMDGDDYLFGGDDSDSLVGGLGDDTLLVTRWADIPVGALGATLRAGGGRDTLNGGRGSDWYVVNSQSAYTFSDTLDGYTNTVASTVDFSLKYNSNISSSIQGIYLIGKDDLKGTGSSVANTITGNDGGNFISAEEGNDLVEAGLGSDYVLGGDGNDTLFGGGQPQTDLPTDPSTPVDLKLEESYQGKIEARQDTDWLRVSLEAGRTYYFRIVPDFSKSPAAVAANSDIAFGVVSLNYYNFTSNSDVIGLVGDNNNYFAGNWYGVYDHSLLVLDKNGARAFGTVDNQDWRRPKDLGQSTGKHFEEHNIRAFSFTAFDTGEFYIPVTGAGPAIGSYEVYFSEEKNLLEPVLPASFSISAKTLADNASNTVVGGAGNDYVVAGNGRDTAGNRVGDLLLGDANLPPGAFLNGVGGSDTLLGGDGNDTLDGGNGVDSLIGGKGDDLFYLRDAGSKIIEKVSEGLDTLISGADLNISTQAIENIEVYALTGTGHLRVTGSDDSNLIYGNLGNNTLTGALGKDSLYGGAGQDSLDGGGDDDYLDGGVSAERDSGDTMKGGSGNDTYVVYNRYDRIEEEVTDPLFAGDIDTVHTYVNFDPLGNEDTNNVTRSRSFANNWTSFALLDNFVFLDVTSGPIRGVGNARNNSFTGNSQHNVILGLDGDDIIIGNEGNDSLYGDRESDAAPIYEPVSGSYPFNPGFYNVDGLGVASVNFALPGRTGEGQDFLDGGAGDDLLSGNAGSDNLIGGDGNDLLLGGRGQDSMVGGKGNDSFYIDMELDVIQENPDEGNDWAFSRVNIPQLQNDIENIVIYGAGLQVAVGNSVDNMIYVGQLAADLSRVTLSGGDGNDTLRGYFGQVAGERIFGYAETPAETAVMSGRAVADYLNGGSGNDYIDGGAGADILEGGLGNDTVVVNATFDTRVAGDYDRIWEFGYEGDPANGGTDWVVTTVNINLRDIQTDPALLVNGVAATQLDYIENGMFIENIQCGANGNINASGNWLNNIILGNLGNNILSGELADDTLVGDQGNDQLFGGDGVDSLTGASLTFRGFLEIDWLTGDAGADIFVLGDSAGAYYQGNFDNDYAHILDAGFGGGIDRIMLKGAATGYRFETDNRTAQGRFLGQGDYIYVDNRDPFTGQPGTTGAEDDLIAFIQGPGNYRPTFF